MVVERPPPTLPVGAAALYAHARWVCSFNFLYSRRVGVENDALYFRDSPTIKN